MRALGLDLGQNGWCRRERQCRRLAMPIEVLSRLGDRPREHRAIAELVEEWEAEIVVVACPTTWTVPPDRGQEVRGRGQGAG